jgi:hypothetical protein
MHFHIDFRLPRFELSPDDAILHHYENGRTVETVITYKSVPTPKSIRYDNYAVVTVSQLCSSNSVTFYVTNV